MNTDQELLIREEKILIKLGKQIKLARLSQMMKAETVALNAGIGRMTLYKLEKGNSGVSIGVLLKVLLILGLEKNFANIAAQDRTVEKQIKKDIALKKRGISH
jgi:transcriptional regulator with XRE-family HTH domain